MTDAIVQRIVAEGIEHSDLDYNEIKVKVGIVEGVGDDWSVERIVETAYLERDEDPRLDDPHEILYVEERGEFRPED